MNKVEILLNEDVRKFLLKLDDTTPVNFKGLVELIEEHDIPVIQKGINGGIGFASEFEVYLDILQLDRYHDSRKIAFIILHELSHYFRNQKLEPGHTEKIYRNPDYDAFIVDVIYEEMFANRLAHLLFYQLNGETINFYPSDYDHYDVCMQPIYDMVNIGNKTLEDIIEVITFDREREVIDQLI